MPQMAPISWLLLFFIFLITFIIFNIMNYYSYTPIIYKNNSNIKMYNSMNWKW